MELPKESARKSSGFELKQGTSMKAPVFIRSPRVKKEGEKLLEMIQNRKLFEEMSSDQQKKAKELESIIVAGKNMQTSNDPIIVSALENFKESQEHCEGEELLLRVLSSEKADDSNIGDLRLAIFNRAVYVGSDPSVNKAFTVYKNRERAKFQLLKSAAQGDVGTVQKIITENPTIECVRDRNGDTPLSLAIINRHYEVAKMLIDAGHRFDTINQYDLSPLDYAILGSDNELVEVLDKVHAQSGSILGEKNIFEGVKIGSIEDIKQLLTVFHADRQDELGNSLLACAVENDRYDLVRILVEECNVITNTVNKNHQTPLDMAKNSSQIYAYLVSNGGLTAMQCGYKDRIFELVQKGNERGLHALFYESPLVQQLENDSGLRSRLINARDAARNTPLIIAVSRGCFRCVKSLVDVFKSEIHAFNEEGDTAFDKALMTIQHSEIAEYLAKKGARCCSMTMPLEQETLKKEKPESFIITDSPLEARKVKLRKAHVATRMMDEARLLQYVEHSNILAIEKIEKSLLYSARDEEGNSPLALAVIHKKIEVQKYLVKEGADVNDVNKKGDSILDLAKDEESRSFLLQQGAVTSEALRKNAAERARNMQLLGYVKDGKLQSLQEKLQLIDPEETSQIKDSYGNTLLAIACAYGHSDIVKMLIEVRNVKINTFNCKFETPLDRVKKNADLERYLEGKGALSFQELQQRNLFTAWCEKGYLDAIVKLMETAKNDKKLRDKLTRMDPDLIGGSPIISAAKNGQLSVVKFLVDLYGYEEQRLQEIGQALKSSNMHKNISTYLEGWMKQNQKETDAQENDVQSQAKGKNVVIVAREQDESNTLLHQAVLSEDVESVKVLIKSGTDINVRNKKGHTPLDLARMQGNEKIMRELTQKGAFTAQEIEKREYARNHAKNGKLEALQQMLDAGVSPNATDEQGNSLLMLAALGGHRELVHYLLEEKKADTTIRNNRYQTALDVCEDPLIADILRAHGCLSYEFPKKKARLLIYALKGDVENFKEVLKGMDMQDVGPGMGAIKDAQGNTPLSFAVNKGHQQMISYLCETCKVDVNEVVHGKTAADRVIDRDTDPKYKKLLMYLFAHGALTADLLEFNHVEIPEHTIADDPLQAFLVL